jgi:hypothetical protein
MRINPEAVSLRMYQIGDIDDDIFWLNQNVDWIKKDTPWEAIATVDEGEYRKDMLTFIAEQSDASGFSSRLEICVEDKHVVS